MAPQYIPLSHSYSTAPSNNLVAHHQHAEQLQPQHNPFAFTSYSSGGPNGIVPVFGNNNYIRPRPQQATLMPNIPQDSFVHSPRNVRQNYVEDHHYSHDGHHSQSPPNLKYEPPLHSAQSSANTSPSQVSRPIREITNTIAANGSNEEFGTEVDTLMKAIQAKEQSTKSQSAVERSRPVLTYKNSQVAVSHDKGTKKRYQCKIGKCTKSFYQKTHLEIHERAHTGVKPYVCTYPGCDRTFSQHGNLRTHLRRHTGERPYQCDQCGRLFAQKGNVRAHKVTHSNEKPFVCHLDDCGKEFTQRGNLKSHQNKFHAPTIKKLTAKFTNYQAGDTVTPADKALWEYFADLYKNSNKGIKGRGKDRKIDRKACSTTEVMNTSMRNLNVTPISQYGPGTMRQYNDIGYEIDDSGSHSGSSSNSSQGSCYDDAPSDGYEDFGRMH